MNHFHFGWYLTAERIVALVYLFSIVCVLLGLLLGVLFFDSSGRQVFIILTVPFSTLFFLPIFHIAVSPLPLWVLGRGYPVIDYFLLGSSPMPASLKFFMIAGWLGLLLFYPLVSVLLWNRFQVGWALSFFAAVSTIGLSLYEAFVEGIPEGWIQPFIATQPPEVPALPTVDWIFGVVANSAILLLLWRSKDAFFKPCRPWLRARILNWFDRHLSPLSQPLIPSSFTIMVTVSSS